VSYREHLPQLDGGRYVTDGGLETYLVFQRGIELPEFAAFDLLRHDEGVAELRDYYRPYLSLAAEHGAGFVLESPTWRANPRWGDRIGYDAEALERANRDAIALMEEIRDEHAGLLDGPIVISGCVGPQDDGYDPAEILSADRAAGYHSTQIRTLAATGADLVAGVTMTYADEAIGVVRAAADAGLPAVISFTVETDGRLPSGQPLAEAVEQVDLETDGGPAYFMVNCAHPTHFEHLFEDPELAWTERILGLRANASTRSHAELDQAADLDDGDPEDLGTRYAQLRPHLPELRVLGGCCGTDHRHVTAITTACFG
jgi:S-methylmethionine-dependent homocysteine/selenocysteine methylase